MAAKNNNISDKRRQHVLAWQKSGLSQADYCRRNSLKEYTFSTWKKKYLNHVSSEKFVEIERSAPIGTDTDDNLFSISIDSAGKVAIGVNLPFSALKKLFDQ